VTIVLVLGLLLGFVLLWKGADYLTDGSIALAHIYKIPEFVIGLTIVAFGTSLPELCVNVFAAFHQRVDIVYGNVIGSNISNTLLILGAAALLMPLQFSIRTFKKELQLNVAVVLVLSILLTIIPWEDFSPLILTRGNGYLLLLIFGFFLYALTQNGTQHPLATAPEKKTSQWVLVCQLFAGLVGLLAGARLVIFTAEKLALAWGISEAFIALFMVALGTSLPELVTCIVAARKNKSALILGNILGSNVFNILLVLGTCAIIRPLPFPNLMVQDLSVLLGTTLLLPLLLFFPAKNILGKWKGCILLGSYWVYIGFIFLRG